MRSNGFWTPFKHFLWEKQRKHASPCPRKREYEKGCEREFKLTRTIARSWRGREVVQKHWWDTEYG